MSRTEIFAAISAVLLLVLVLEMVRRRRLREEYSWLWLLTAVGYLVIALFPELARQVALLIGSVRPVSAFSFLGLLFLFAICIQFSVQISRLTEQNKDLAQHVAILDGELRKRKALESAAAAEQDDADQAGGESFAGSQDRPIAVQPVGKDPEHAERADG